MKTPVTFLIRYIDREIWQKFRMICLEKGKSANQYIKELIAKEVKKSGK